MNWWLQHTATHCNTLQYTATPQHTAAHCNTLQHLNTLQHTATHCNTLRQTHCNTLQRPLFCVHLLCSESCDVTGSYEWHGSFICVTWSTRVCDATHSIEGLSSFNYEYITATHCNTLQHTATHCNTLQHTATHYNTLQHTATHCNTLQHTATHCNTLQHTATHCNTLRHTEHTSGSLVHIWNFCQHTASFKCRTTRCNTLQHTATHCNTLQHTASFKCGTFPHSFWSQEIPLPRGVSYSLCSLIKNPEEDDPPRRICTRCSEGGSLPLGSWLGTIVNRNPPGGGFLIREHSK